MLISLETCSAKNQDNQTHCDISTNTLFAKSKHIPKEQLTQETSKPHETLSRETIQAEQSVAREKSVIPMQYPQFWI